MNTRAGNIGPFVFEGSGRGSLRKAAIILLLVSVPMLYVGWKVKIVRLGYQIEALDQKKRELERENRSLRIEASSLASPARIEDIALKRLGMVRPGKDNIVMVKRKGLNASFMNQAPDAQE